MKPTFVAFVIAALVAVPATPISALPNGTKVETYKTGLDFPVDLAWVPGTKKIFYTEKNTGRIRVLVGRDLRGRNCTDLDVSGAGERGALGLVLHPNFKKNHYLYVFYTNSNPLEHRVTRFKVVRNRCRRAKHIVTGLNADSSGYHNGGQLEFVKGKLFVSTGEAHSPSLAQDTGNRLGKILRLNPNGSVPSGNPFDNAVWSYGHRNPFGLTHRPGTDQLFETENGPSCDDEFNRIRKGRNYGWGSGYVCGTAGVGDDPKAPLLRWGNVIVPTDPWWYEGRMDRLDGDVYVGDYNGGRLHRLVINRRGSKVREDRVIHDAAGGIVDVTMGPGRWLYFATSNAIYRIVPN